MKVNELFEAKAKKLGYLDNCPDTGNPANMGFESKKNYQAAKKALKASGLRFSDDGFAVGFYSFCFDSMADLKKALKVVKPVVDNSLETSDKPEKKKKSLKEAELKAPAYAAVQKAVYDWVLPKFLAAQDAGVLKQTDLSIGILRGEAENDRFWVSSFDDAYSTLKKYASGNVDRSDAINSVGAAMDEVAEKISDYYSNRMNFEPGTKLPKLKKLGEVDVDDVDDLIERLIPGVEASFKASRMRDKASRNIKEATDIIKLTVKNGTLYANGEMLMTVGEDVETPKWPFKEGGFYTKAKWQELLARCLFDARETGDIPSKTRIVLLPDGKEFEFDNYVR